MTFLIDNYYMKDRRVSRDKIEWCSIIVILSVGIIGLRKTIAILHYMLQKL